MLCKCFEKCFFDGIWICLSPFAIEKLNALFFGGRGDEVKELTRIFIKSLRCDFMNFCLKFCGISWGLMESFWLFLDYLESSWILLISWKPGLRLEFKVIFSKINPTNFNQKSHKTANIKSPLEPQNQKSQNNLPKSKVCPHFLQLSSSSKFPFCNLLHRKLIPHIFSGQL